MAVLSVSSVAVTTYVEPTLARATMVHLLLLLRKRVEVCGLTVASMECSCVAIVTVSVLTGSIESIHLLR
jgi:hypothetical protein